MGREITGDEKARIIAMLFGRAMAEAEPCQATQGLHAFALNHAAERLLHMAETAKAAATELEAEKDDTATLALASYYGYLQAATLVSDLLGEIANEYPTLDVPSGGQIVAAMHAYREEWRCPAYKRHVAEANEKMLATGSPTMVAYATYDSDPRVNGPDDYDAFAEAVKPLLVAADNAASLAAERAVSGNDWYEEVPPMTDEDKEAIIAADAETESPLSAARRAGLPLRFG